jgi:cell division protein FtsX
MKFLPLVFKNLKNNRIRTALTVIGVAVAVFVFGFFLSMQSTMEGVVKQVGDSNNLIVLQGNAWCGTDSRIPENYAEQILRLPQVKDTMPIYISATSC